MVQTNFKPVQTSVQPVQINHQPQIGPPQERGISCSPAFESGLNVSSPDSTLNKKHTPPAFNRNLKPTPFTLRPTPCTLHPAPCTLHPTDTHTYTHTLSHILTLSHSHTLSGWRAPTGSTAGTASRYAHSLYIHPTPFESSLCLSLSHTHALTLSRARETLHPTPHTLHPTPYAPTPYTQNCSARERRAR